MLMWCSAGIASWQYNSSGASCSVERLRRVVQVHACCTSVMFHVQHLLRSVSALSSSKNRGGSVPVAPQTSYMRWISD